MELTWLGDGCVRIRGREAVVVCDPYDASSGYPMTKIPADLVTLSQGLPPADPSPPKSGRAAKAAAAGPLGLITGTPKVLHGPGEYEVRGVPVEGVATSRRAAVASPAARKNTAFVVEVDDVRICHLGVLAGPLDAATLETLGQPDVLLVPAGGGDALTPAQAAEVVSQLEPKMVVPVRYRTSLGSAQLEDASRFLKELGHQGEIVTQPKLVLMGSPSSDETKLVVLEPRHSAPGNQK